MHPSDSELLILHTVRLKGFVDAAQAADLLGLELESVERRLADAAADGFVRCRPGGRLGWSLSAEGRKENERLLAVELDQVGVRDEVAAAYRSFLPLNQRLLAACTDWQVIDQEARVVNDHADPDYDRAVIGRLRAIDREIQPICADLAGWLERFDHYAARFGSALAKIDQGDDDWFAKPTIDSYHTVWFELHEDLLATLGLDRSTESAGTGPARAPENDAKED